MNRSIALLVLALVVPAAPCQAMTNLTINSHAPVLVFLDSEEVGLAPLTLKDIPPGPHHVRMVNQQTGASLPYDFVSPHKVTVGKNILADFPRPLADEPRIIVRRPVVVYEQPVYVPRVYYYHRWHRW